MLWDIMTVDLLEDSPILDTFINCVMAVPRPLLYKQGLLWVCKTLWALDVTGVLSNIPVVCFNSVDGTKFGHQCISKDRDIIPFSALVRITKINNFSC